MLFSLRSLVGRSVSLRSFLSGSLSGGCLSSLSGGSLSGVSLLGAAAATTGLLLSLGGLSHVLIEVNEFDEGDGSSVTLTGTELDDAGVATGTVSNTGSDLTKELLHGVLVLQIAEHNAAAVGGVFLRAGNQGLYILLQSLGFCESRSDSFVHDQARSHVGKHAATVRCSTAQMVEFLIVSHFLF